MRKNLANKGDNMHKNIDTLFKNLWQNYISVTPTATKIHELFSSSQDSEVVNDHIALRTFNLDKVNLEVLAKHFIAVGYKQCGEYNFKEKKLNAKHYEHSDLTKPKVFISELKVEEFDLNIQDIIKNLVNFVSVYCN